MYANVPAKKTVRANEWLLFPSPNSVGPLMINSLPTMFLFSQPFFDQFPNYNEAHAVRLNLRLRTQYC